MKFFSRSEKYRPDSKFFFIKGAKNIIPAIEHSLTCDTMSLVCFSIKANLRINIYKFFLFTSVVINVFSDGDAIIFIAIC